MRILFKRAHARELVMKPDKWMVGVAAQRSMSFLSNKFIRILYSCLLCSGQPHDDLRTRAPGDSVWARGADCERSSMKERLVYLSGPISGCSLEETNGLAKLRSSAAHSKHIYYRSN